MNPPQTSNGLRLGGLRIRKGGSQTGCSMAARGPGVRAAGQTVVGRFASLRALSQILAEGNPSRSSCDTLQVNSGSAMLCSGMFMSQGFLVFQLNPSRPARIFPRHGSRRTGSAISLMRAATAGVSSVHNLRRLEDQKCWYHHLPWLLIEGRAFRVPPSIASREHH